VPDNENPDAQAEPRPTHNRPQGGRPSRRGGQQIELAERRAQVLEMRKLGISYRDIGLRLGIDHKTAMRDKEAALKAIIAEPAEEVRKLEVERLEFLWRHAVSIVVSTASPELRLRAMDTALRIAHRRAAMEGIDEPQKIDIGPWLEKFAREQGLDPGIALETAAAVVKELGF
jgi:hypothetical protein